MKKCNCTFHQYMVGDGCPVCNPQKWIDFVEDTIEDLETENDTLAGKYGQAMTELAESRDLLKGLLDLLKYKKQLLLSISNEDPLMLHDINCEGDCEFCKWLEDVEEAIEKIE